MKLRIQEVCRSRQVTLSELARWTGIARVSLSRYAHGVQDMTLGQLAKIASALGCRVGDLLDDREDLASPGWQAAIRRQAAHPANKKDKAWVPRALLAAQAARSARFHEKT